MKKWWTKIQRNFRFTVAIMDSRGSFINNARQTSIVAAFGSIILVLIVLTLIIVCISKPVDAISAFHNQIAANAYEPGAPQMTGGDNQSSTTTTGTTSNSNAWQATDSSNPGSPQIVGGDDSQQTTSTDYVPPIDQNQNFNENSEKSRCTAEGWTWDDSRNACKSPGNYTLFTGGMSEDEKKEWCESIPNTQQRKTRWVTSTEPHYCQDATNAENLQENATNQNDCELLGSGIWGSDGECYDKETLASANSEDECKNPDICGEACTWDENDEDGDGFKCSPPASTGDDSEDTCESNFWGFGWIFCPGQNLITELINGMVGWIADSMKWTILADDSATNTAGLTIRQVWQNFLNIANVVFVIAFLIMIYSMATSTGLSNYDVKKMLPRLIIVVIAVNLSFYICAALVDLSNIIGAGLYNLIYGQTVSEEWDVLGGLTHEVLTSFGSIVVVVLALFLFGGTAIIGIAIILLLIMFRQIALMALVIISPVAFAMYMLPNTQKWADKWKDMFVRLLIVYPMFTAVWGAAHLAADTLQGATGLIPGFIVSLICAVAPVVAIVPLFKMSGGLMAMAAGAISGSALARGSQKWINSKTRNNPASRLAARGVSKVSGGIATGTSRLSKIPFARTRPIRRGAQEISNKTGQFGNSLNTIDDQLDAQSVERGKTANLGLTSAQVAEIARTGGYINNRGKSVAVDSYQRRAAMDQVGDGMSYSDVESMLVNTANEASQLEAQGRTREAAALRESAYKAAKASGNALVSSGSLQDFRNGSGNWGNGNAQAAYDNAVSNYAGGLSVDQASKLSAKKHEHLQNKVSGSNATNYQSTIESAMNNAKAQSNMNQGTRDNLNSYLSQVRQASRTAPATAGSGPNNISSYSIPTVSSPATAGSGGSNTGNNSSPTASPTQRVATDPLNATQRAAASAASEVNATAQAGDSGYIPQHMRYSSSNSEYQGKHFRQNTSGSTPTSNTIPSANNNSPMQGTPPRRP